MVENIVLDEVLEHFLNETYKSIQEIKELASDVIRSIADNNIEYIQNQGELKYLFGTYLKRIDSSKYNELKDFIEKTNIAVSINDQKPQDPQGNYSLHTDHFYNPNAEREINVYIKDLKGVIDGVNEKLKEKKDYNSHDLYLDMFNNLYSTLIHELQHAYDDYRSENKSYRTKEFSKYKEKYMKNAANDIIDGDVDQFLKYIKLPHEIWARFSQAMYDIHFTEVNWDKGGDDKIIFDMKPIHEVVKDFKYKFRHFKLLSDKMKRKLINKVVQFWHYEQDKLPETNKRLNA